MKAQLVFPGVVSTASTTPRVANRLVLVPGGLTEGSNGIAREQLVALARQMGTDDRAYIYIAVEGQKDAEDDEFGVRYLPLHVDRLPCFGSVQSVLVYNDRALAAAAASAYPTASVFHLDPAVLWVNEAVEEPVEELLAA